MKEYIKKFKEFLYDNDIVLINCIGWLIVLLAIIYLNVSKDSRLGL